jgi:hypothetical protein
MKPVRTLTPAWEISDWPVKVTGTDGTTGVDFCIERVLLHSANNGLDNHYFPAQSTLSLLKHAYSAARYEIPGLNTQAYSSQQGNWRIFTKSHQSQKPGSFFPTFIHTAIPKDPAMSNNAELAARSQYFPQNWMIGRSPLWNYSER